MTRTIIGFMWLLSSVCLWGSDDKPGPYPSFDYEIARAHEIRPHRQSIPIKGVAPGFHQLHLNLTVSAFGDVIDAEASGDDETLPFWPQLRDEVIRWKFTSFEEDGKPITAEIEEYIDLVPPERMPKNHVAAPLLRPNSKVAIVLQRSGCFGSCPSYTVTVSTEGIEFEGRSNVVASGKHRDTVDPNEVRKLANRFVASDFYSMEPVYRAAVTDSPTYVLSIAIDSRTKEVVDYVGSWEGMPAVVTDLEDEVDELGRTARWIDGSNGLVEILETERFTFRTFGAQVMLKEAATRGKATTVKELLDVGVPLEPLPSPIPAKPYMAVPFDHVGWLNAASSHLEVLRILLEAGASKSDQGDKDLALAGTARSGNVEGSRLLIAYGANPNADLSELIVTEGGNGMTLQGQGAGSVLIYAASSGNPEMLREILRYRPKLEMRSWEGKTAIFAAGESGPSDKDGARVECVRLLAQAGADVNARDNRGNTPLHETYLTDVEAELLNLGADVNARNKEGETPIFTTIDDDAIPLFIEHGADLSIRNNKGETVVKAAKDKGPHRQEALQEAIQNLTSHSRP